MIRSVLEPVIGLLAENPVLLLFVVAGLGWALGRVSVAGFSLGVSGVLFAGLAIGALDERLRLPEIVYTFGLAVFVYTVGLTSGPGFVATLRRGGVRRNLLVVSVLVVGAGLAAVAHLVLDLEPTLTAGLFAGSLTNTPALGAVLETLRAGQAPGAPLDRLLAEPVAAYSLAYPMGVVGMLGALHVLQRRWRIDYAAEARTIGEPAASQQELLGTTVRLAHDAGPALHAARGLERNGGSVTFGRLKRDGRVRLVTPQTDLRAGDLVTIIAAEEQLESLVDALGVQAEEHLEHDRSILDFRRIILSDRRVAGRALGELSLPERFGGVVTRLRRGDADLVPAQDTVLELGDRVRVVAPRQQMRAISDFFGDSYRRVSEVDIATFSLGIGAGLLLGSVPIPYPGGEFKLGVAGGPLVVALLLGARERTGPLLWTLPFSASLTLRQFGSVLFFAGIGTRAGHAFGATVGNGGLIVILAGTVITVTVACVTLMVGYKLLRIPFSTLSGILAGLQTQPAVLAFASERSGNELPGLGWAQVYPAAMLAKIVLAQLLLTLLD